MRQWQKDLTMVKKATIQVRRVPGHFLPVSQDAQGEKKCLT